MMAAFGGHSAVVGVLLRAGANKDMQAKVRVSCVARLGTR